MRNVVRLINAVTRLIKAIDEMIDGAIDPTAEERKAAIAALDAEARRLGVDPALTPTQADAVRRAWAQYHRSRPVPADLLAGKIGPDLSRFIQTLHNSGGRRC